MTRDAYYEALRGVKDPELALDIVTLGLVYDLTCTEDAVQLTLTLTSLLCPFRQLILDEARRALAGVAPHDAHITLSVVFDPPWEPSPDLRVRFGI